MYVYMHKEFDLKMNFKKKMRRVVQFPLCKPCSSFISSTGNSVPFNVSVTPHDHSIKSGMADVFYIFRHIYYSLFPDVKRLTHHVWPLSPHQHTALITAMII